MMSNTDPLSFEALIQHMEDLKGIPVRNPASDTAGRAYESGYLTGLDHAQRLVQAFILSSNARKSILKRVK